MSISNTMGDECQVGIDDPQITNKIYVLKQTLNFPQQMQDQQKQTIQTNQQPIQQQIQQQQSNFRQNQVIFANERLQQQQQNSLNQQQKRQSKKYSIIQGESDRARSHNNTQYAGKTETYFNDQDSQNRMNSQTQLDENEEIIQHVNLKVSDQNTLYNKYLEATNLPELIDLKFLYNPLTILGRDYVDDEYNQKVNVQEEELVLNKIQSSITKQLRDKQKQSRLHGQSRIFEKSTVLQTKKEKKYKHFISKLIIKGSRAELYVVDLSQEKPLIKQYPLTFDFGKIPPSPFIIQEYSTGRYFIYDNNNKILCFSRNPEKNSDRDDKSRPLIEMFLEDENPRIDPTLYIKEFENFSCLLVIGGYKKSKMQNNNSQQIFPQDTIKVFKLEKKMVSTTFIFELKLNEKRMNPIIVKTKELRSQEEEQENNNEDDEDSEQYDQLLILIGGNNIAECKKNNAHRTTQSIMSSNETGEIINCTMLKNYTRRGLREEGVPIQKTIRLKYNDTNENIYQIKDCMFRGCVISQKIENPVPRRFLFADKKGQVLEIKYINVKEKVINIGEGEFGLSANSTVFPSMARRINDRIYYVTDNEKKVRTINLKNMSTNLNNTYSGVHKEFLQSRAVIQVVEPLQTAQEKKGGICSIF